MIKKYLKKLSKKQKIIFILVCIIVFFMQYFHIHRYISLTYLHQHMHMLQGLVNNFYGIAVCCYMLCYTMATICSIPGSSVFTIAGGLLFGVWPGILYALISATCGGTVLLLISRYFIGNWVQHNYEHQLCDFNQEIETYGHYYLLVVRLIALLPFCVVNMLSGLTLLRVKTFVWVTFVGLIPVSLVYTFAGKQLAQLQSVDDFYSPSVIVAFAFFILFKVALVPIVVKMYKRCRQRLFAKSSSRVTMDEKIFIIGKQPKERMEL